MQAFNLARQQVGFVAVQPIVNQQDHRPLPQDAARPARLKAASLSPMRVPPDQSCAMAPAAAIAKDKGRPIRKSSENTPARPAASPTRVVIIWAAKFHSDTARAASNPSWHCKRISRRPQTCGQHLGDLSLADPRLALQKQRLAQSQD